MGGLMENQESKPEEKKCCGIHCSCCVCKAIKAVVLLLLGGVIGFFIGRCGSRMCPVSGGPAPMVNTAPSK